MNNRLFILISLLLFILHTGFREVISIAGIAPDFMLLILILLFPERSRKTIVLIGLILGFIQDVSGGGVIGYYMLCKIIAAFLLKTLYSKEQFPSFFLYSLLLIISAVVHEIIHMICLHPSFNNWALGMLRYGLPSSFYTILVGIPLLLTFQFRVSRKYE